MVSTYYKGVSAGVTSVFKNVGFHPSKTFLNSTRAFATKPSSKSRETVEKLAPLGPWIPKEAKGSLPDVSNIKPTDIQLQHHPRYRKQPQTLLRAIDLENRFR